MLVHFQLCIADLWPLSELTILTVAGHTILELACS